MISLQVGGDLTSARGMESWHPLAPIRLANAARSRLRFASGKTKGEGMPLH